MQVLKKFGLLLFISILGSFFAFAQSVEDCGNLTTQIGTKRDPIDFIHNQLLKSSASNPVEKPVILYGKNSLKSNEKAPTKVKLPTKPIKKSEEAVTFVNEQAKMALHTNSSEKKLNQEIAKTLASDSKTSNVTNANATAYETSNNRLVTKNITPKKEEQSFGSSMMEWVKDKYSCMIDVLPNQISNVMLYRFIDEWYGVKYRMGGTSKKGVDCSAFVQSLYKYVFNLDLLRTACLQFNSSELIKNPQDLKEGDLVFFRVKSSRISHVGVYLRNNFFVHSASSKGVSIANLSNAYWSKYFAGGGRIKS